MYALVAERIRARELVDSYYYEKSLRVIADAVHGRLDAQRATGALAAAVAPTTMNTEVLV